MDDWLAEADSSDDAGEWEREREARRRTHFTAGFREAIDAGWEETAQEGFNIGFSRGMELGLRVGEANGALSAIMVATRWGGGEGTGQLAAEAAGAREAVAALPVPTATLPEGSVHGSPRVEAPGHSAAIERADALLARAGAARDYGAVDPTQANQ